MNSEKSIQERLEELKPEEYTDFINCLKENYRSFSDEKYYNMLAGILHKEENRAYFNTLSKGCQLAMLMFVSSYEHNKMIMEQVSDMFGRLMSD